MCRERELYEIKKTTGTLDYYMGWYLAQKKREEWGWENCYVKSELLVLLLMLNDSYFSLADKWWGTKLEKIGYRYCDFTIQTIVNFF